MMMREALREEIAGLEQTVESAKANLWRAQGALDFAKFMLQVLEEKQKEEAADDSVA